MQITFVTYKWRVGGNVKSVVTQHAPCAHNLYLHACCCAHHMYQRIKCQHHIEEREDIITSKTEQKANKKIT